MSSLQASQVKQILKDLRKAYLSTSGVVQKESVQIKYTHCQNMFVGGSPHSFLNREHNVIIDQLRKRIQASASEAIPQLRVGSTNEISEAPRNILFRTSMIKISSLLVCQVDMGIKSHFQMYSSLKAVV